MELLGLAGLGAYLPMIETVGNITLIITGMVIHIYAKCHRNVRCRLVTMDLDNRLNILNQLLIIGLRHIIEKMDNQNTHLMKQNPVYLCAASIRETMVLINNNLHTLNNKIDKHKNKYFAKYRKMNIENVMDDLQKQSDLLYRQFKQLINVTEFLENINIY